MIHPLKLASALACVAVFSGTATAVDNCPKELHYLEAGDSYSSGRGQSQAGDWPDCARDPHAWPEQIKNALRNNHGVEVKADFTACSGAWLGGDDLTKNNWAQQTISPDRKNAPYDLITFTFGGDDVGFGDKLKDCLGVGRNVVNRLRIGIGVPDVAADLGYEPGCSWGPSDISGEIQKLKDTYESTLDSMERNYLKPSGHIIIAGYPHLFAPSSQWGASPWCVGMGRQDADMINAAIDEMNNMIRAAIKDIDASRITFVDPNDSKTYPNDSFEGHGLCSGMSAPWINGPQWPVSRMYHPSDQGDRAYANMVGAEVKRIFCDVPTSTPAPKVPVRQQKKDSGTPAQQQTVPTCEQGEEYYERGGVLGCRLIGDGDRSDEIETCPAGTHLEYSRNTGVPDCRRDGGGWRR